MDTIMTDDELKLAMGSRLNAKRLASRVKAHSAGRMNPQDTPWHEASELADAADSAAWCIGWLVAEIERLRPYETFYRELETETRPGASGMNQDAEMRRLRMRALDELVAQAQELDMGYGPS
jgi:hypothetical protein